MTEDRYLTVEEVAERLRRHPRTIRNWISEGCPTEGGKVLLAATKAGKGWLIHSECLSNFEHRIHPLTRAEFDPEQAPPKRKTLRTLLRKHLCGF